MCSHKGKAEMFLYRFRQPKFILYVKTFPEDRRTARCEEGERELEEFRDFSNGAREDNIVVRVVHRIFSECFRSSPEQSNVRERNRLHNALHSTNFLSCRIDASEVVLWQTDCKWEKRETAAGA